MASSDNFAYFRTEYEKNPFTIEEQLYLKDINLEGLLDKNRGQLSQSELEKNYLISLSQGLTMRNNPIVASVI